MRAEYERVYMRRGHVAHLKALGDLSVLCAKWHQPAHWWLGTGSQEEIDHAAAMPLCKSCEQLYVTTAALNYGKGES